MPRERAKNPGPKAGAQQERADFALPANVYDHISRALKTNTWGDEVEVLEHNEYLLFPCAIHKRKTDGTFEEKKCRLRVPREHEMRKARAQAREIMAEDGLDWKEDPDLFTNVETWCILAQSIRDYTEPFAPFDPDPRSLEKRYDKHSLMALWAKLDAFTRIVDPRPDDLSSAEIIGLIVAIAREENTGPLAVYGSHAQSSCIVTMARLCAISLGSKSFLERLKGFRGEPSVPTPSSSV